MEEEEADRLRLKAELKAGFTPVIAIPIEVVEPTNKSNGIWSSLTGAFRTKKD